MPRSKKVIKEVVRQIDEIFRANKTFRLPASVFHESIRTSKLTLGRARIYLHIQSKRTRSPKHNNRFITYWFRGTYSLASAMQEIEKAERQQIQDHAERSKSNTMSDCCTMLENLMTAEGTNYDIKGNDVIAALRDLRGRRTIVKAKNTLGIRSVKRRDGWYWLWPAQEIQDWLENLLLDGPVNRDEIYSRAFVKKGWSKELIDLARYKLGHGNIIQYYSEGEGWLWKQV